MKTKIIKVEADWVDVKNVSRTTVNKEYSNKEATTAFKKQLLISEHSPIRLIKVRWKWENILSWVSVHFSRHRWECFISTQRDDRTGKKRSELSQSELVNMDSEANAQHLIDTGRKRLCFQSSPETRRAMEELKIELKKLEPEVSDVIVPQCIYRCGCSEFKPCEFFNKFESKYHSGMLLNIQRRYDLYNEEFHKTHKGE